jgi:hypothetical protein
MKHIRIESLYIGVFAILFIAGTCEKGDDPKPFQLNGTWRLTSLVNISDQQKYLNAELEFGDNNQYKHYSNTGALINEGSYEYEEDTLRLGTALFENVPVMGRYGITSSNGTFTLKERYTADNKDAILEYVFEKK